MRPVVCASFAFLLVIVAACSSSRSPRCKEICQRESQCIRELRRLDIHFDEAECIAACTVLDRDSEGRRIVDQHAQCIERAGQCEAVLQCR
jgi:hypothetical protein